VNKHSGLQAQTAGVPQVRSGYSPNKKEMKKVAWAALHPIFNHLQGMHMSFRF
jgi:hypothetical protein